MFIVIEGGDASGKTTLVQSLQYNIANYNIPFPNDNTTFLKSPTAPFDQVWKDLIKTSSPLTRFYLFRTIAQNDAETVKKLLADGKNVFLERNFYSSEAFNWALDKYKGVTDPELLTENHVNYGGLVKPDAMFFLDVSNESREKRMQDKEKATGQRSAWEITEFQKIFNDRLRYVAKRENMIFIDTDKLDAPSVTKFVISQIKQLSK